MGLVAQSVVVPLFNVFWLSHQCPGQSLHSGDCVCPRVFHFPVLTRLFQLAEALGL